MNPRYYTALRNYCTRYGIDWRFDTIQNPITLIWQVLKVVNELVGDMDELQKAMTDLIESLEGSIDAKVVEVLQGWLLDGTLEEIVNDALFNEKANKSDLLDRGVNVIEYGVDVNSDDVSTTLQLMIDTFKNVYLPNGVYKIKNTLVLPDECVLTGESVEGVVILNDSDPINPSVSGISTIHVQGVNVVIKNISVKGKQLIDESTQQFTIGTGHNILVDNLNTPKKFNLNIENVKLEDGYNGLTFQRGASGLKVKNIKTINHHHGIQIFQSSEVSIDGHVHETNTWCKRGITIHSGARNVVYKNSTIKGTDLCGIYLRFESLENIMDIENVEVNSIKVYAGAGNRQTTFSGVLVENNGSDKYIKNITFKSLHFENILNGFMLRNSDQANAMEKIIIDTATSKGITSFMQWGGSTGLESNKYNKNFIVKNIITDGQIRARLEKSIVTNTISTSNSVDKSIERMNIITDNIESDVVSSDGLTVTNGIKTGDTVVKGFEKVSGTTDGTGLISIPYPTGYSRDNTHLIDTVLYSTNNIPFNPTITSISYSVSSLNIQLSGESTYSRPFKCVVMSV